MLACSYFYPRSPCGERRGQRCRLGARIRISIHALLAESDLNSSYGALDGASISIHALLAESDVSAELRMFQVDKISIHALLAESDIISIALLILLIKFLSTLSLRRATGCGQYYIRAREISIHALLAESDRCWMPKTATPI